MKIILAGYNVDADVLEDLKKTSRPREDVTPETLSAAYARISRDPRPIDELRNLARQEVEKARSSNQNIIFKMGHHSIAEHAIFNFDLIDVSRLALEEIEKFRLCSYTEKSQRYQKLENSYLVPEEIRGTKAEGRFLEIIKKQNNYYQELIDKEIEPEDARYVTSLATLGQVGLTINARNLELLFRRFASHALLEIKEIGQQMYQLVEKIAPSIILFTEANPYDEKTYSQLREYFAGKWEKKRRGKLEVELVDYTAGADIKLVTALLHTSSGISFRNCRRIVRKKMNWKQREEVVTKACQYLEFYDAVLREFEHLSLTYDLVVSAACFGQLKRHRMSSITGQRYDPQLGATIPPKIVEIDEEKRFLEIIRETEEVYKNLVEINPLAAQYILTNAHRKRVLMTVNARELYHLSRFREDLHAQWDIRDLATQMVKLAKEVMPLTMMLIGGKDSYPAIYEKVYHRLPKLMPPQE